MFPVNRIYIFTLTVTLACGQLIKLDKDGNVGVNFAGYHASAGLGGLLSGDVSKGGLHAEAGTPFGQSAGAGLGGAVGSDGKARGVLFAGATAGNGVSAGAGLGGETGEHGGVGHAAAGASAGGVFKGVEKTSFSRPGDTVVVGSTNNVIPKEAVVEHYPIKVIEKTYSAPAPPPLFVHKQVSTVPVEGSFLGRLFAGIGRTPVESETKVHLEPVNSVTKVNGQVNSRLFDDIFNIPISTLAAVNRLVSNIVDGKSGSVTVRKDAHVYK